MRASDAPQATGIEVVATQPTKADRATLAMFESTERKTLTGAAYIVKVRLKTLPEPTSRGFALYVGGRKPIRRMAGPRAHATARLAGHAYDMGETWKLHGRPLPRGSLFSG